MTLLSSDQLIANEAILNIELVPNTLNFLTFVKAVLKGARRSTARESSDVSLLLTDMQFLVHKPDWRPSRRAAQLIAGLHDL